MSHGSGVWTKPSGISRTPVVFAAPTLEPLTRPFVKNFARWDDDCDDEVVDFQIAAARQFYERRVGRQLMLATYDYFVDDFPPGERFLEIPRPPLVSIVEIEYRDTDDVLQILAPAVYDLNSAREPGRVFLQVEQEWPDVGETKENAVRIRFTAGAATVADVPTDDRQAVLMLATHWLQNREPVMVGDDLEPFELPLGYDAIEKRRQVVEIK